MSTVVDRLAVDGGRPVRAQPWPERIQFGTEELQAATAILERATRGRARISRYAGEQVVPYEREFAAFCGVRFGAASSSGTAAIHCAVAAGHFEPGDEVITTPITDPGGVNPILMQNLIPVFADVEPDTLNIDPRSVRERVTDRTRAILATHLAGQPCRMDEIVQVAKEFDLILIEDCSQAHGAKYKERTVGSIGDLGAFSLTGGKHTTAAGEGGMTVTDNPRLWDAARRFNDKGKGFDLPENKNIFLGLNYRLTEIQAAIGREQLKKLPGILERRRHLAERLRAGMRDLRAVRFWKVYDDVECAYWFCFLRVAPEAIRVPKEQLVAALQAEGIPVGPKYDWLLYQFPYFRNHRMYGRSNSPWDYRPDRAFDYEGSCPNAERYLGEYFWFDLHESCTDADVDDAIEALHRVERAYLA